MLGDIFLLPCRVFLRTSVTNNLYFLYTTRVVHFLRHLRHFITPRLKQENIPYVEIFKILYWTLCQDTEGLTGTELIPSFFSPQNSKYKDNSFGYNLNERKNLAGLKMKPIFKETRGHRSSEGCYEYPITFSNNIWVKSDLTRSGSWKHFDLFLRLQFKFPPYVTQWWDDVIVSVLIQRNYSAYVSFQCQLYCWYEEKLTIDKPRWSTRKRMRYGSSRFWPLNITIQHDFITFKI